MKYKHILVTVFLVFFIISVPNTLTAQKLCGKCEEAQDENAQEGLEEGAESSDDFVFELGEEAGEMSIDEADLLGAEVADTAGEVAGEVAGEEIAVELSVEILSAGAEMVPFVGPALMMAGMLFSHLNDQLSYDAYKRYEKRHHLEALEYCMHYGDYSYPDIPIYHLPAEDLNGAKDTLSYLVYLKKTIGRQEAKKYYRDHSLIRMQDDVPNRFPQLEWRHGDHFPDMTYVIYDLTAHDLVKERMGHLVFNLYYSPPRSQKEHYELPFYTSFSTPTITFSKASDGGLNYSYTAHWQHTYVGWYYDVWGDEQAVGVLRFKAENDLDVSGQAEFVLTTQNSDGSFTELTELDVTIDDVNDQQLAFKLHDVDISDHANSSLYISMKIDMPRKHATRGGESIFPENFDPKSSGGNVFRLDDNVSLAPGTMEFLEGGDPVRNLSRQWYPNSAGSQPSLYEDYFMHFRIHDYQPRDTDVALIQKQSRGVSNSANPFPVIYNTGSGMLGEIEILEPDYGNSNLYIEYPTSSDGTQKKINYIELEDLITGNVVILHERPLVEPAILNAHVISKDSKKNKRLSETLKNSIIASGNSSDGMPSEHIHTNDIIAHFSDEGLSTTLVDENVTEGANTFNRWILHNVPFSASDKIEITTHYEDNTLTRGVVAMNDLATGIIPRGYYTINVYGEEDQFLKENEGLTIGEEEAEAAKNEWLIDYIYDDKYAIMNRDTKKVLGVLDGELGMYDWNMHDFIQLLWHLEITDNEKMLLLSPSEHVFLTVDSDTSEPTTSLEFYGIQFAFTYVDDGETIISNETVSIRHDETSKVMEVGPRGNNLLLKGPSETHNFSRQTEFSFNYVGCLKYSISNQTISEFLDWNQVDGLHWNWSENDKSHVWFVEPLDQSDSFVIYGEEMALWGNGEQLFVHRNPPEGWKENNAYHFSKYEGYDYPIAHYALDGNADDSTVNVNHGTASGGVSFVEDSERGTVAQFDGLNDYISTNFDFSPLDYEGGMTISAWFKTDDWNNGHASLVSGPDIALGAVGSENKIYATVVQDQNNYNLLTPDTPISENQWNHIALTVYTDTENTEVTQKLYVNGVEIGENTEAMEIVRNSSYPGFTTLGNYYETEWSNHYYGYMDDVKIWGRAMDDAGIFREYQKTIFNQSLVYDNYSISNYYDGDPIQVDMTDHSVSNGAYTEDRDYKDEWLVEPQNEGEYLYIRNRRNMRLLDVADESLSDEALITTSYLSKSKSQRWKLRPSQLQGYFYLQNMNSGKCITNNGDGTYLQKTCFLPSHEEQTAQIFIFDSKGGAVPRYASGEYTLHTNQSYFTDLEGLYYENLINVDSPDFVYWDSPTVFDVQYQGAGLYRLSVYNNASSAFKTLVPESSVDHVSYDYRVMAEEIADSEGSQSYHEQLWSFEKGFGTQLQYPEDNGDGPSLDLFDIASAKQLDHAFFLGSFNVAPTGDSGGSTTLGYLYANDRYVRKADWSLEPVSGTSAQSFERTKTDDLKNSDILQQENNNLQELTVYPNRSEGIFNISFNSGQEGEVGYEIFDLSGRSLQSGSQNFSKGDHTWQIDARRLSSGSYVIVIMVNDQRKEERQILISRL